MGKDLYILVCKHLIKEAEAAIEAEGLTEAALAAFSPRCGRTQVVWEELASIIEPDSARQNVIVLGGQCLNGLDHAPPEFESVTINNLDQCFYFFTSRNHVDDYQKDGAYLLTPGWLACWRYWLEQWGFDRQAAREFFSETVSQLLLLDTGIDPNSSSHLRDFAEFVDRPTRVIRVGLDYFKLYLTNATLKWRLEKQMIQSDITTDLNQRQMADYALTMDLLSIVSQTETEEEAISKIIDLFTSLCAPGQVHLLLMSEGKPRQVWSLPPHFDSEAVTERLAGFDHTGELIKSGRGFRLRIGQSDNALAIIELDDVAFPDYNQHYLNLGLAISDTCALAINHGRKYNEIKSAKEEQERLVEKLQNALAEVKTLKGFIPICSNCKKIRDDEGYWEQVEKYVQDRSDAEFSHSVCPDCIKELYPELAERIFQKFTPNDTEGHG